MNNCDIYAENQKYMKSAKLFKRGFLALQLLFIFTVFPAMAEVNFGEIELYSPEDALFSAEANFLGEIRVERYSTLFQANIDTKFMEQLTFFPERVLFLKETGIFQISNRYGVFRSDNTMKRFQPVLEFPAFVKGNQVISGKISESSASPDGRWLLYVVQSSVGYGNLILLDLLNHTELIISSNVEHSYSAPRAKWSKDSRVFIYEKKGSLYYSTIDLTLLGYSEKDSNVFIYEKEGGLFYPTIASTILVDSVAEKYRKIADGRINNVIWSENSFFLLKDNFIFKIQSSELFTASLYSGYLDAGEVLGRIPFTFEPSFDNYWVSPDGKNIIISKGGRNIFYYKLDKDFFVNMDQVKSLPHVFLPRNTLIKRLLWNDGVVTILVSTIVKGEQQTSILRLDTKVFDGEPDFEHIKDMGIFEGSRIFDIVLSPDGKRVAVVRERSVEIKMLENWEHLQSYYFDTPLHVVWLTPNDFAVFGKNISQIIKTAHGTRDLITISQTGNSFYDQSLKTTVCRVEGKNYLWDGIGGWSEAGRGTEFMFTEKSNFAVSADYRLFTENLYGRSYKNIIYVRDLKEFKTYPLFPLPIVKYDPIPEEEDPVDFNNFSHGSRKSRYISLVFNAVKDDSGLTEILNLFSSYGIKTTFFVSGDFIKRNPGAVTEIADSGHETGSLFYYYFNLTTAEYVIDRDFIIKGLASNEDEYFNATRKELGLFWHAPYYFVNSAMIEAAREMNYTYIGRDVITLDSDSNIGKDLGVGRFYKTSAEMLDIISAEKKPGSIIPITLGKPENGRADYLFQNVEILINNLIVAGYEIVPVSVLIEKAK